MIFPTYKQIEEAVRADVGRTPKSCWIADVKEREGLATRPAWNRSSVQRANPCPDRFVEPIRKAICQLSRGQLT